MKIKNTKITLDENEYLVTPESIDAKNYKVFYKDKEIKCTGIIRFFKEEDE